VAKLRTEKKNEQEINALVVRAITLHEFDSAIDNVKLGEARESRFTLMTAEDKWNTTVHEVGHGWLSADKVTKVTIVPREMALGYTEALPEGERYGYDVREAKDRIIMAMGGRVAQEVFTGTVDSGASNDFKQATNIARKMVTEWGMSKLGHISVGSDSEGAFMGQGVQGYQCGPELSAKIDTEVSAILEECYNEAKSIIERDKEQILEVCLVLFKQETVLAPEWTRLLTEFPPKGETPATRARSKPKFELPASRLAVAAPAEPAATEEVATGEPTADAPVVDETATGKPADGTDGAPKA
jgi:cell division protease FtsH